MKQNHEWEIIAEVYNQDEAQIIAGLLRTAAIPVKIDRETLGNIYGLTVGPLAKIRILVPIGQVEDAEKVLAQQNDENGADL
jgi:hypothetical protein